MLFNLFKKPKAISKSQAADIMRREIDDAINKARNGHVSLWVMLDLLESRAANLRAQYACSTSL